jgi:hypothetical protein
VTWLEGRRRFRRHHPTSGGNVVSARRPRLIEVILRHGLLDHCPRRYMTEAVPLDDPGVGDIR